MPAFACSGGASLWSASVDDIADTRLERTLGSYFDGVCWEWVPSDRSLADLSASDVPDRPDVWTDGSLVLDQLSGLDSLRSGAGWFGRRWEYLELLPPDGDQCFRALCLVLMVISVLERCVLFDSIRGPLQSVQRAELWKVILASAVIWESTVFMWSVMFLVFWMVLPVVSLLSSLLMGICLL